MGLFDALHGLTRLIVIAISIPFLLVGLTFAGAAIADDGGAVMGGGSADASVQDLAFGVGFGSFFLLLGGIGLYKGVTGNLTSGDTSRTVDAMVRGDADDLEEAISEGLDGDGGFGDGDGGFGGGFDGADGGAGGDGGGGGGGGGGE